MNNFDDITLLSTEYKLLKKCNHSNGFIVSYNKVKNMKHKNLVIPEKLSDLANSEVICRFYATDKGKRYIVWHRRHFIKSYYPIAISFVALGISALHILLEIYGVI